MFLRFRIIILIISLAIGFEAFGQHFGQAPKDVLPTTQQTQNNNLYCTRVVDGDTIQLSDGQKVRLIGVDTPETVHPSKPVERFGKEASAYTKKLVEGKTVFLEYDQQRTDKYGRTLAYVYLKDGTHVNAAIIQNGFGFAYTKYPFKYMEKFRNLERIAREQNKGLWENERSSTPFDQ